jgi:hypothetical protein
MTPNPTDTDEREVRFTWNLPQSRFMQCKSRYVNFEGAIRAGKSTPLVMKTITLMVDHPGIKCSLWRWTGDALETQLIPLFWELCPKELLDPKKPWDSKQEFVRFLNGSLCYLRSLRPGEGSGRYIKCSGLTLATVGVDQPEEVPEDIFLYLKGRMSQPGYPHQMLLTPNPPGQDHWICREFPTTHNLPNHEMIHTTTYDNRHILGEEYIADLELSYPPGHPMRHRMLEGKRGLQLEGEAVYGKIFKRDLHIAEVEAYPDIAVMEAWDFSKKHPAVLWSQFTPGGGWWPLMEYQGESIYLEELIPIILAMRQQAFPTQDIWPCCDPSGADTTSHGTSRTAVEILGDQQIFPAYVRGSNQRAKRTYAINQLARFMLRLTASGPALQAHPRCGILIDGFQAGYVYPEKSGGHNIRVPLKDGYYDNLQNCAEYTMLNFLIPGADDDVRGLDGTNHAPSAPPQRDIDPMDPPRPHGRGLAGY